MSVWNTKPQFCRAQRAMEVIEFREPQTPVALPFLEKAGAFNGASAIVLA